MTGLTVLFKYPNHVVNRKAVVLSRQSGFSSFIQIASMMLHVKKGTQQIRKTPVKKHRKIQRTRKGKMRYTEHIYFLRHQPSYVCIP